MLAFQLVDELWANEDAIVGEHCTAIGFPATDVLPVVPDFSHLAGPPTFRSAGEFDDGWVNILFVGRIVPNKRIDDHIRLAEVYKRYVDNYYRFIFVGRYDGVPAYYAQVRALIAEYRMLPDRSGSRARARGSGAFYRWAMPTCR
jgi:glycosyltransferase involved in cell wall biosynthesis